MNPRVQDFIDKKKYEERKKAIERRNIHLIRLGLVDENKTEREYVSIQATNTKYDQEKGKYYIERNVALEVTDEEYAEICKYDDPNKVNNHADIKMRQDISSINS